MTAADALLARLLANGPFRRNEAPYALLCVAGRDAADFLQRLCSQDVKMLPEGTTAPAAFLDAKGKVVATCLLQRLRHGDEDVFWIDTQAAQQGRLAQLLERYHFTEKLVISTTGPGDPVCEEWIGAAGASPPARGGAVVLAWTRGGVQFVRRHAGRGDVLPPWIGAALDADRSDCLQMAAGIVSVGVDTEASTLALEAFLDDHCSTTKGCYTGQEIVARIHTYGHTNRALCLLELSNGPRITAPVVLHECEDDLPVGRVMRAVPQPGFAARLGLGYLPKDFQHAGARLRLAGGGDAVVVRAFLGS
jgi:folate-binding protein YgfZ